MKIGVVGCGALGSYYGAMLWRAGHDVHFLLRSDFDVVHAQGVQIESPAGNFVARPCPARSPVEIGVCDFVLVGLKTTANHEFSRLLPPLVGPETAVLTLQNGLGNEEALAELFPAEQIFGGLCFVCLNRLRPGYIRHIEKGFVLLGEFMRAPEPRTHDFARVFEAAGVKCTVSENLQKAHWEKLVWNVPFNGLGVAGLAGIKALSSGVVPSELARRGCLPTDELLRDVHWTELVHGLMLEVIHTAAKLGHDIPESLATKMIERTRGLGTYRVSTLIDFERGQPLELDSLFLEPLRQARRVGASTPLLTTLCAILAELDCRRSQNSC